MQRNETLCNADSRMNAGLKRHVQAFEIQRNEVMAERTGLEPATPGVTGRYSNQLNYRSR